MWSFNDGETSTSKYTSALEEEVEILRKSVDNLQNKLRVGLEIENHLKKKFCDLEKKRILSEEKVKKWIAGLLHYHSLHRVHIMNLLDEGYLHLKSTINSVEEKIRQIDISGGQNLKSPPVDVKLPESECRDVHINTNADLITKGNVTSLPSTVTVRTGDASTALARALHEKVAALLLLSQQEERHLLDRNVHAALERKMEELQRNLLQVTNEKVKALMELAQLKQEYHLLQKKVCQETKQGKLLTDIGQKRIVADRDGSLINILKKTYMKRWIGTVSNENGAEADQNSQGNITNRRSNYSMDFARMKIENATLKESLESMEHLTSSVRRLRLALLKVKVSVASEDTAAGMFEALDNIVTEAKLVKTALGSFLPVSWSAEADVGSLGERFDEMVDDGGDSSGEKVDFVSAAGFEMVELLILAAQILKDAKTKGGFSNAAV
ncbi:unnamed protein product [Ilex paraguariensis]|uniref:Uncharacterized protein n=1 Tax=Ilex paraguariensis TaxID=185542 RepID=A0ABC8RAP0_9AQUA